MFAIIIGGFTIVTVTGMIKEIAKQALENSIGNTDVNVGVEDKLKIIEEKTNQEEDRKSAKSGSNYLENCKSWTEHFNENPSDFTRNAKESYCKKYQHYINTGEELEI